MAELKEVKKEETPQAENVEPAVIKKTPIQRLREIVDYRDFFGEYPIIFAIKIISSISLIYVITEFYSYHNPLDSLITKYAKGNVKGFDPKAENVVIWGFLAGFGLYFFTLFKGKYKFLLFLFIVVSTSYYLANPALDCQTGDTIIPKQLENENWKWKPVKCIYDDVKETNNRIDDLAGRATNLIFGSIPFLGAYGIWKKKGWAIAGAIGLSIIIGFLYTPNACLDNFSEEYCGYSAVEEKTWSEYLASGIYIGLGFVIFIELSYAAIKYENYAAQFKPAGLDDSLLTPAQKKAVSRTLMTLFVSYLINLAVMLFVTFTIATVVININDYLSTTDGQIQDSIELQGPYGIVFTSLIFFMLLGFVRMFIGADYETEES